MGLGFHWLKQYSGFTWKHSQALDYLTASGLHGNPVIAHQESKHDQGHKLTGVGLQRKK